MRNSSSAQPLNWRTSSVDLLKLLDIDSSLAARKELAAELDCPASLMADSAQMNGCAAERNPGARAAGPLSFAAGSSNRWQKRRAVWGHFRKRKIKHYKGVSRSQAALFPDDLHA